MYYLVPPVLVGKRSIKYPRGWDSQATRNWLWLGPDKALLWTKDPIADRLADAVAEDKDELAAIASRSKLAALVGDREISAVGFKDAIANLLLNAPADKRWNAIRPSKARARYEIFLGPGNPSERLFWTAPSIPTKNTKTYVDSFDRANSGTVGTSSDGLFSWTEASGTVSAITSNTLTMTNIPDDTVPIVTTSADTDTDDSYAFFTLAAFARASGTYLNAACTTRGNAAGSNGYVIIPFTDETNTPGMMLYATSADSAIDTDTGTPTIGHVYRIEADGSSIIGYDNGTPILSATNAGEASGAGNRRGGLSAYSGGNSTNDVAFNDFGYGDIVAGISIPVVYHHRMRNF